LKTTSILHVNSQSLVLADYGVKTGYCQLYGASLLHFSVEMFPASTRCYFWRKTGKPKKTKNRGKKGKNEEKSVFY
jgi:hypothetical protein